MCIKKEALENICIHCQKIIFKRDRVLFIFRVNTITKIQNNDDKGPSNCCCAIANIFYILCVNKKNISIFCSKLIESKWKYREMQKHKHTYTDTRTAKKRSMSEN